MRPTKLAALVVLSGCLERSPDATESMLVIEPSELSVTIVDGKRVMQPYTATLVDDGGARDVTAETTFLLADGAFGAWSQSELQLHGATVGATRVVAVHGALRATGGLEVRARDTRFEGFAPLYAPVLFERAVVDVSCTREVAYPVAGTVLPRNLGPLDVQWHPGYGDLVEVTLASSYYELGVYTDRAAAAKLEAYDWNRLVAAREPIDVRISSLVRALPTVKCSGATRRVLVTDEELTGAMYYSNEHGIWRHDAAHAIVTNAPVFAMPTWEQVIAPVVGVSSPACHGCALARDGSRIAVASPTSGAIYDFASQTLHAPRDGGAPHAWDFATWNRSATKLVTSRDGELRLIEADGALLATASSDAAFSTNLPPVTSHDPQLSPDGRLLANVIVDEAGGGATIVLRPFVDDANAFVAATPLVPLETGVRNYFPAWSPDGRWIVYTRATGWGTSDVHASLWIMRSDGSQAKQLTPASDRIDMRARFMPRAASTRGEHLFFITFESTEPFAGTDRVQLWAMPFYPDRTAVEWSTASGFAPAFHLPQPLDADNRLLQWTN